MRLINVLVINFILFSSIPCIAETYLPKSEILRKSKECFKESQNQECKNLILQIEKIQLAEFEKNRFKCQTSILGLQTEILEAYFFEKFPKKKNGIMIPYVIKNC